MVITYHGVQFFKIQYGDKVVALNPVSKDSKFKTSKFGADLCLITLQDKDMNGVDQVTFGEKNPFVIKGPGEYEVGGVFVKGFQSNSTYGGRDRINTIYVLSLDSINVCFLGALSDKKVESELVESLGDIDILFVPVGGEGMLNAAEAYKLAVSLEPKVIIPMHYAEVGKDILKQFLKEGGSTSEPIDKLTVKRKDLDGKGGDIIVLSAE